MSVLTTDIIPITHIGLFDQIWKFLILLLTIVVGEYQEGYVDYPVPVVQSIYREMLEFSGHAHLSESQHVMHPFGRFEITACDWGEDYEVPDYPVGERNQSFLVVRVCVDGFKIVILNVVVIHRTDFSLCGSPIITSVIPRFMRGSGVSVRRIRGTGMRWDGSVLPIILMCHGRCFWFLGDNLRFDFRWVFPLYRGFRLYRG